MLAIRMQRSGRKGHATYRVVVQDSRRTPTSGKIVASLGSYDPHTKTSTLVKAKAQTFLDNGAQPSDRVIKLFATEGVKLPKWVKQPTQQKREIRNLEKLRRNRPAEPEAAKESTSDDTTVAATEESSAETTVEKTESENTPATETSVETTPTPEDTVQKADENAEDAEGVPTPGADEYPEDKTDSKKSTDKEAEKSNDTQEDPVKKPAAEKEEKEKA